MTHNMLMINTTIFILWKCVVLQIIMSKILEVYYMFNRPQP